MTGSVGRGGRHAGEGPDVVGESARGPTAGSSAAFARQYENANVRVRQTNISNESDDCFVL